ncbi:hypothetical protein JHD48_05845 [Sulfurimonas sp. SAG-AH-194-I05]|nr:CsgG/HfaB family protein [Sulfurimonas sp. SAG-AH-194-I05]MDF1875248.1 hypothetical protein [Sulfurimonas sp. SAG-AH-194-I05]
MIKSLVSITLASSIALITSSCGTQMAHTIQPKIELAEASEITVNINKYTDGLDTLNELLDLYGAPSINIAAYPVQNRTADGSPLPTDITIMVNSALNEIGHKVTAFSAPEHLQGHANAYIIEGAITEYDVLQRGNRGVSLALHVGKGKGESDGNSEASDDDQTAKLTIDFNIIDASTGAYVSKVHTSNSIKIMKKSESADYGFSILGSGFGINASTSKEQGKHAAIRLLVDLSMIELIAKLQKQPYWICVPGAKKDRRLERDIKRNFTKLEEGARNDLIIKFLGLIREEATLDSIISYKKEHGIMPVNSEINADLYMNMLENAQDIQEQKTSSSRVKNTHNNLL